MHHMPASKLGDGMPQIYRQFTCYIVGKTTAKEKQTYAERLPSTSYSTHLFFDKRMLSFSQLLPTLEDGSSGEDRKWFSPYNDVNRLHTIRDDTISQ